MNDLHHINVQSTGQNSHSVKTLRGYRYAMFRFNSRVPLVRSSSETAVDCGGRVFDARLFVRPEWRTHPEGKAHHPARDRGLRAAPKGEPSAAIHTGVNPSFSPHTSQYSPLHQKPSAPAFGSKPSLTLRWALSQALPRQYSTRLTPGAGFGPSLAQPLREELKRESAPRLRGRAFPVAAGI